VYEQPIFVELAATERKGFGDTAIGQLVWQNVVVTVGIAAIPNGRAEEHAAEWCKFMNAAGGIAL
jgi:hypothetical protein